MDVIGFGALNLDHFYEVTGILPDGEHLIEPRGEFTGGSAGNTIFGLAKLGLSTGFIGAVGDDPAGQALIRDFEDVDTDVSLIKVKPRAESGMTICIVDSDKRAIYVRPQANSLLAKEDIDISYINEARLVHLSSFADDAQFDLQKWVLQSIDSSILVSFSPGSLYVSRTLQKLLPLLERTTILFLNKRELEDLTGETDFRKGCKILFQLGCKIVVVTFGKGTIHKLRQVEESNQPPLPFPSEEIKALSLDELLNQEDENKKSWRLSAYIARGDSEHVLEAKACPVIDPTGAGDAFAVGFLYAYLKGKGIKECGKWGNMVATFCIQKVGCRTGLPNLLQLRTEIEAP